MRRFAIPLLALFTFAALPAWAADTGPGADVNAAPSGPPNKGKAGSQRETEEAFAKARAECRGEAPDMKRDCVVKAQKDNDKTDRVVKPPKKEMPLNPSR
jgi:hypothetical protein